LLKGRTVFGIFKQPCFLWVNLLYWPWPLWCPTWKRNFLISWYFTTYIIFQNLVWKGSVSTATKGLVKAYKGVKPIVWQDRWRQQKSKNKKKNKKKVVVLKKMTFKHWPWHWFSDLHLTHSLYSSRVLYPGHSAKVYHQLIANMSGITWNSQ